MPSVTGAVHKAVEFVGKAGIGSLLFFGKDTCECDGRRTTDKGDGYFPRPVQERTSYSKA